MKEAPLRRHVHQVVRGKTIMSAFVDGDEEQNGRIDLAPWWNPEAVGGPTMGPPKRYVRQSDMRTGVFPPFPAGAVVVVTIGSVGRTSVTTTTGVGNEQMICLVPTTDTEPRFLRYALIQSHQQLVAAASTVTIAYLPTEKLLQLYIPPASLEQQRRIADFLDDQVARLDRAVELRREQLRIMEIAELSILDGVFGDGDRTRPVKSLVRLITSGPRGWGDYISESGTPFVRIANIPKRGITLLTDNLQYVVAPTGPERQRSRTRVGDVLISITADLGSTAVVPDEAEDGNVSQHVALLRPIPDRCSAEWLAWAVRSPAAHSALTSSGYGGTKAGLGLGEVGALRVPDATISQQVDQAREIAQVMEQMSARDRLATRHIQLLQEKKQALITAAVTGEIDVTTARVVA